MIPKECKRLAEVDFPIAVVSRHSVREKSVAHGHPNTLHLWWARRPLAACRAMLLALLLPDPCDTECPADFKRNARALLPRCKATPEPKDTDLRKALLRFIGDFANWDLASNPRYLEVGRGLIEAAHGEETPLIRRSLRRRRLDSVRSTQTWLRSIRERPQSGCMPDSQGNARGHSAARAGAGGRALDASERRSRSKQRRNSPSIIHLIPMARPPSHICGREPFAANRRTVARKSHCCVRSGSARRRADCARS